MLRSVDLFPSNLVKWLSIAHPSQAHFNVFSNPRKGRPWGNFTTSTIVTGGHDGPYEGADAGKYEHASKISNTNDPSKAVLLGRLRFKPDSIEPTTAK